MELEPKSNELDDHRLVVIPGGDVVGPDDVPFLEGWLRVLQSRAGDSRADAREPNEGASSFIRGMSRENLLLLCATRIGWVVESYRISGGQIDVVLSVPAVTQSQTPLTFFAVLPVPGVGNLLREN